MMNKPARRISVDFRTLYAKAIRSLSLRDHSIKEIRDKLKGETLKGGAKRRAHDEISGRSLPDNNVIDLVIDKLLTQRFLDDAKFTENFIRFKLSQKPLGETALFFQLKKKGINDALAKTCLRQVFSSPDVALQLAKAALLRKKITETDSQKRFAKQVRFLASRGFSYTIIRQAIDDSRQKE